MVKENKIDNSQKPEIEKIKKQKVRITKIVMLFSLVWILAVVIPVCRFVYTESTSIKNYMIVKGVYESNKALMSQYQKLTATLSEKININQYTQNIKLPEIKLDEVSKGTNTVTQTANFAAKLGIKEAAKVADTSSALQKQVDKINNQIQSETAKLKKTLEQDLNKALETELNKLADEQMQDLLRLNKANYTNLVNGNYGYLTQAERNSTNAIYKNFVSSETPILKNMASITSKYFKYISWTLLAITLIISLIPVFIAFKISKFFTQNFAHCPYCGKYYLTSRGKLNLLLFFKFW